MKAKKSLKGKKRIIVANLLFVAVVMVLTGWHIDRTQQTLTTELRLDLLEIENDMVALLGQNPKDFARTASAGVISECGERAAYDEAMSKLSQLRGAALLEAKRLHESCGSFTAAARAYSAATLEAYINRYTATGEYLAVLEPASKDTFVVAPWVSILETETQVATMFKKQADMQKAIISALEAGDSKELNDLVIEANRLNELLGVTGVQLAEEKQRLLES